MASVWVMPWPSSSTLTSSTPPRPFSTTTTLISLASASMEFHTSCVIPEMGSPLVRPSKWSSWTSTGTQVMAEAVWRARFEPNHKSG